MHEWEPEGHYKPIENCVIALVLKFAKMMLSFVYLFDTTTCVTT